MQDKILQSTGRGHEVTVTNDGATILKSLHIDNAAAKVLVGILKISYRIIHCRFCLDNVVGISFSDIRILWMNNFFCGKLCAVYLSSGEFSQMIEIWSFLLF